MDRENLCLEEVKTFVPVLTPKVIGTLSERELQVLAHGAAGLSDKKICEQMGIALNTLRTYWQRIRGKLGQLSRSALAVAYTEAMAERHSDLSLESIDIGFPVVSKLIVGYWKIHLDTDELRVDREFRRIYRLDAESQSHLNPNLLLDVHPSESEMVAETIRGLRTRERRKARITHRLVFDDGTTPWITHDISVVRERVCGTAITIPELDLGLRLRKPL